MYALDFVRSVGVYVFVECMYQVIYACMSSVHLVCACIQMCYVCVLCMCVDVRGVLGVGDITLMTCGIIIFCF